MAAVQHVDVRFTTSVMHPMVVWRTSPADRPTKAKDAAHVSSNPLRQLNAKRPTRSRLKIRRHPSVFLFAPFHVSVWPSPPVWEFNGLCLSLSASAAAFPCFLEYSVQLFTLCCFNFSDICMYGCLSICHWFSSLTIGSVSFCIHLSATWWLCLSVWVAFSSFCVSPFEYVYPPASFCQCVFVSVFLSVELCQCRSVSVLFCLSLCLS